MYIVLLSGGSGKRLWPLSNEVRSKQFLRVVRNGPDETESMIQRVYRQLRGAGLSENVVIATSAAQTEAIKNQLGVKVSVVVEPERRNTFPAIALAAAHLRFNTKCADDETVVVLPVDPFVGQEYFETIHKLDKAVLENASDIVLMGVKPIFPSEKYGYIIPCSGDGEIFAVSEFREKPDISAARGFIERGALWNCGVFAFKLEYLINLLTREFSFYSYEDVFRQYGKLEKTSFDYAVVEKSSSVSVIPYNGGWKDLGTWNTLTEVMNQTPIGDVKMSDDCENTHAINELDIPVIIMGAKDMVVAASPDGILVSDKQQSSYIKEWTDDLDRRPMFEERHWGEYKVLDLTAGEDGMNTVTKRKIIKKDSAIEYQSHKNRMEVWTVLSGKCIITINNRAHEAYAGDTYSIPESIGHGLSAITDVEIIEIQVGRDLAADETEYLER